MKGQVSLEFLIVLTIFLSMLVVSFSILMNVKHTGDNSVRNARLMMSVNDLENTANEVCVLGEGTQRMMNLPVESLRIETAGEKVLKITYMNETGYAKIICKISDTPGDVGGRVYIQKESDGVAISAAANP